MPSISNVSLQASEDKEIFKRESFQEFYYSQQSFLFLIGSVRFKSK